LEIKSIVDKIDGWLTFDEGKFLYHSAMRCKGNIVEIGSWKGKSTIWLGNGSKTGNNSKIYAIDPHTGPFAHKKDSKITSLNAFKKNIKSAGVADVVKPIVKSSEAAAKNFKELIELLFIDGDHDYAAVKLDFEIWSPKLADGGIIAFHDSVGDTGPAKVIKKEVLASKMFVNVGFVDGITFATKVKSASFGQRLKNRYVLFIKEAYAEAGRLHLPKFLRLLGKRFARIVQ